MNDEPLLSTAAPSSDPAASVEMQIRRLVNDRPFGVLSTQAQGQPYASLIAFAFTPELRAFYFSTPKATRKFRLLSQCARVALLVDDRCLHPDHFMEVQGVTFTGKARHMTPQDGEWHEARRCFLHRHPQLRDFLDSPSTALFHVDVVRAFHVSRFQQVIQWTPEPA